MGGFSNLNRREVLFESARFLLPLKTSVFFKPLNITYFVLIGVSVRPSDIF